MKKQIVLGLAALVFATGCDNEPAKDKTKVEAKAPIEAAPVAAEKPAATVKYVVSAADSSVEYVGAKVTAKHEGKFNDFKGTIELVDGDITKSKVNIEIQVASIDSDDAKLTSHLKSPDLLDAEKFPTATFESTSITAGGNDGATHTVTGNLTLHGEKKAISFPANIKKNGEELSVQAEFAINRKDFGVVYPGMPDDLIKDDVLLKLKLNPKKG